MMAQKSPQIGFIIIIETAGTANGGRVFLGLLLSGKRGQGQEGRRSKGLQLHVECGCREAYHKMDSTSLEDTVFHWCMYSS